MVHEQVLKRVDDADLRVYVLWEAILRSDSERAARRATMLLPDPRVVHFWAPSVETPEIFRQALPLEEGPAWDVYLVYPPGVTWTGTAPPEPAYYMHQLSGRLPAALHLQGDSLAARVRQAAGAAPAFH